MEVIIGMSWSVYSAWGLIGLGMAILVGGLSRLWQPLGGNIDALRWTRGLRRSVLGLSLVGIGVAWLLQLQWLLVLSLVVAAEELWETSAIIYTLERDPHRRKSGAPTS